MSRRQPAQWQLLAAGLVVGLAGTLWFVPLPRIVALRWRSPRTTAFIEARKAKLRADGKSDAIDRRPVSLRAVSPALVRAVVVAEDARFWQHHGIDWTAVREAAAWNRTTGRRKGRWRHGASTITQQLVKNLWLSGGWNWWRKGREAAIALALDALVPKEKILEHYLSAVEWGERVWGAEAAARTYFGVPASRLDERQAAWLAAMIPNPAYYLRHPDRHARRAALIEKRAFGREPDAGETDLGEEPEVPR
jgi:monofunctional biosynthetic peptidoglycan transglycosylase